MNSYPNCTKENEIASLSTCLEDALAAALRGAFELALEISVKEVSRVVTQALRDAQHHIHETQQENNTLKLRLQHNQTQSSASTLVQETFYEIGDDGCSHSHDISCNGDMNENKTSNHLEVEASDEDPASFQSKLQQVEVKDEEPGLDDSSGCCFDGRPDYSLDHRSEEFGLDRIDLVQSKLLEDWRPDSEKQPSDTDRLDQDLGVRLTSSDSVSSMSTPFHDLYQSVDKTSRIQPPRHFRAQGRTDVQAGLYICKFCGHAFHSESDRRKHNIKYHKNLKRVGKGDNAARFKKQRQCFPPGCSPFRCTVCHREFNRMENLKTHVRIHTGERPYSCTVCGKLFRHGGALTRHFRIHTGEKPYVCSECGKSFRNGGGLRSHQKSHKCLS